MAIANQPSIIVTGRKGTIEKVEVVHESSAEATQRNLAVVAVAKKYDQNTIRRWIRTIQKIAGYFPDTRRFVVVFSLHHNEWRLHYVQDYDGQAGYFAGMLKAEQRRFIIKQRKHNKCLSQKHISI